MPHFVKCPFDVEGNDSRLFTLVQVIDPGLGEDGKKIFRAMVWKEAELLAGD